MARTVKKKLQTTKGKNIRFSDNAHELLSNFCKQRGYNLGAFCEIASLNKLKEESYK